ncbi:MAG: hypothetical protein FWB86_13530 [Treponema sp.]|nr:hypothetical protein [Treponema sp.]
MKNFLMITIIAITAMAFTACTKKSETQTSFNIYSVWRYASSADVEHGGTWVNENEKSIAIYNDGEYAVVISGSYAWRGVLHDRGDYSYTFNAVTRFDFETGTVYNAEGQSPYTFVLKYDPQTRRLVSADGTVEEYYEWFSESELVPDIGFSNTHQEILTADPDDPVGAYKKILAGDFSDWSGIWVNAWTRNRLFANGIFVNSSTSSIDGITTGDFKENNGAYIWGLYDGGRLGYEIGLFPAGVPLMLGQNLIVTDTAMDRIIVYQFDGPVTNDDVFYKR